MLLDQIAFKDERFEFRTGDDRFEVCGVADQDGCFRGVVGPFLKVRPHTVRQNCGFPYIEQFALLVPEQIDTWVVREVVEFRLEFWRGSHQRSAFSGQQGKNVFTVPF